jgi:hypothetical protein
MTPFTPIWRMYAPLRGVEGRLPGTLNGSDCLNERSMIMQNLRPTRTILFSAALCAVLASAQDAAPADRNAINTKALPGGMMADSPVTFPKQGALPAHYPPDVEDRAEPSEKDYFIFSTPCRSLAQIAAIQRDMPYGQFHVPPADWTHLRRTRRILTEGGDLRLLALGDSIVNDTMRSGWVAQLQEAYPKARIQATVYVRGGGGCQHYREEGRIGKYVVPRQPDLVCIGGISQKDVASIGEVIRQLRAGLPEVEILLATGTFGTADPRDPVALASAPHSGTGVYGDALKSLAAEQRCAYLDMTGPWAEYIRSSKRHPHVFYRDVVHANEHGEQILAKIMMAFWAAPDARQAAPQPPWPQRALEPPVLLPDSSEFTTWEPAALRFTRTYHVNASQPGASDENPGTAARPFVTLNRAAQVLQPGERVIVGPGIYRERIRPARGGTGPSRMISYEAEPDAQVILRGSRVFLGSWARSPGAETNVWSARLDPELFDGYQPFRLANVTETQFESMDWAWPQRGKVPFTLVRGLVFQDGRRLAQVADLRKDYNAPNVKFVLTTGCGNPGRESFGLQIAEAQLAIADANKHPEFAGNVKAVDNRGLWREANVSPKNQGYHDNRNAETYLETGLRLGWAMADPLKPTN